MSDAGNKYFRLGKLTEFPPDRVKLVQAHIPVAVATYQNHYQVFEDYCPHRGGPLSEGLFSNGEITCPWHSARFSVVTGEKLDGPGARGLKLFKTRIVDEFLEIELPDSEASPSQL